MGRSRVWSKQAFLALTALSVGVLGWSVALAAPPTAASGKPRSKAASVTSAAIALPPAEAGAWSASIVPSTLLSLAAVGADVYAGMSGGGLLKSSDHGQHFRALASPSAKSLWARSESEVYAGYANVISRSTDHGQTWQEVTLAAKFRLSALWGTGTTEVYVAGSTDAPPLVYYSKDSGKTFEARKVGPESGLLLAIGGSGPKEVVVGGADISASKALLFRSTDQGKHWSKLAIPKSPTEYATSSINGVCFTRSGKLFVATSESVFISRDKGAHWKLAVSSNNAELLALVCHDSEVFVATRGHTVLHSSDDGARWSPLELASALPDAPYGAFQAVGVGSDGALYVGGEGTYQPITGAIYRRAGK